MEAAMSRVAERHIVQTEQVAFSLPWGRWLRSPLEHMGTALALLLCFCGFLFFYGLTHGELYRTEGLRALLAAEFLRSGNWIVPTLYGEPLLTKPPGMYAAIAVLSWPFGGVNAATARLPSALAATGLVLAFYGYFRRQFGNAAGFVAALILPTSFMWLDKAPSAEIDMLEVAWVGGAILCFVRALEVAEIVGVRDSGLPSPLLRGRGVGGEGSVSAGNSTPSPPTPLPLSTGGEGGKSAPHDHKQASDSEWRWWLAALLCVAGGFLTKWTAPVFFYGTAIPLLLWRRRLRLLFSRAHLISLGLCSLICLAWIVAAISLAGWPAFREAVTREGFMHLLPSHNPRPYPWLLVLAHPFKVFATNVPWSAFALLTLWPGFGQHFDWRGRRVLQGFHCWTWPNLLFWSIIPEHSTRHSFPLFPGIAGLAVCFWWAWMTGRVPELPWMRPGKLLVGIVVLWLTVKVLFVQAIVPARDRDRQPRAKGELIASLVPPQQTLHVFRLKDEGIMFYYGRPVRRLPTRAQLSQSNEPQYCVLDQSEWHQWQAVPGVELVQRLQDEQGAPIFLIKSIPRAAVGCIRESYP
jgi:4-amino-4-deoxy-L-arabinose transferase-like glycosyltransferase